MIANKKVRIGFVGAGMMGQCAHLQNYSSLEDCEVVALAELREETGALVARRYGIPGIYRDYAEMLKSEKLDALVAAQPFSRHGTIIPELLASGLPIFCEKPLAGSIEMGEKVLSAVKENGGTLVVGYNKRSDPAVEFAKCEMKRLAESGELGKLTYIRILMPPGDWVAGGRRVLLDAKDPHPDLPSDPASESTNESDRKDFKRFVNYYIHQVNLLRYLLGEPYQVTHADPSGVLLVARSEQGIPGILEMQPYRTTLAWQESILIAYERGYIKLELTAPLATNRAGRVELLRDPGGGKQPETVIPQLPWQDSMRQQAKNFIGFVQGKQEPKCLAEEAMEDLKIARDYLALRSEVFCPGGTT